VLRKPRDGTLARDRAPSLQAAANRLNGPIEFPVRFRGDQHTRRKCVPSCIERASAAAMMSRARTSVKHTRPTGAGARGTRFEIRS